MLLTGGVNRVSFNYVFSSNTTQTTITPANVPGYQAGKTDLTITVNSGIYVYSTDTNVAGLTIGSFAVGDTVRIINNGFIIGKGGDSPTARYNPTGVQGNNGGPAIRLSFPVTIDNTNTNAYVAGGGGSGASGSYGNPIGSGGGGAGGGGAGATIGNQTWNTFLPGGEPGQAGGDSPPPGLGYFRRGGAGGRILPGVGGAALVATPQNTGIMYGRGGGAGGSGVYAIDSFADSIITGGGGGWGAAGGATYGYNGNPSASVTPQYGGGGSSNQPAVPFVIRSFMVLRANGGLGGKAVDLQGNSVTWVSGDTTRVWGAIS